ncbi:MAG: Eco57I restriction-modification methylase domain-containing protein [Nitrospirae bacterium]|nr:Eco57I restriction-modification methylase domain-containing protein [Nitrospirota bacterium]
MKDFKAGIKQSIEAFASGSLTANALHLFQTLGYNTERQAPLDKPTYNTFKESWIDIQSKFNDRNAIVADWDYVDLLFQLSKEEVLKQTSLFNIKRVDNAVIESYLFFAIELIKPHYSRTGLSRITREVNRLFRMPVILLFKHGNSLTVSIIDRRPNKLDSTKDVLLKKVSLIKDINITNPHHAHVEILLQFAFPQLLAKYGAITTMDGLYKAFVKVLDTKELNREFYTKISAWYYYATNTIKLPIRPEYYKDDKENVKNFTVRLICRMIFCWFLKERGLINPRLIELHDHLDKFLVLVRKTDNDFIKENSYYRGILQNIFLSCLNSPMNPVKRKAEYLGKKYLPDNFDYKLFDAIPFLNGGLFDRLEEDNYNETIEDGPLYIPNELFYANSLQVGTGRNARETHGLNKILSQFVFTVDESTPLEEEVALDPELLGLVFENLLAEIDPDEKVAKNARKESGSYYTPRKVIDYMVNESLLIYLSNYFKQQGQAGFVKKLNDLIYFDRIEDQDTKFKVLTVDALDSVKVLDPACGSGAFPMGMLHRIVSLLKKVDPENDLWLERQLSKIEDRFQRENFAKILKQHMEDYPRKLGIIKNAIYGIDNQPLATLITKLRFFISLLIEQKIDKSLPQENYHITPLPNIETKVICADSLMEVDVGLFNESVFTHLRNAKESYYKPNLTREDKTAIATNVADTLATYFPDFAQRITGKKMNDQKSESIRNRELLKKWFQHGNLCAPFFNLDLFFPELIHKPFDIVIGNPPYGGTDIPDAIKQKLDLSSKDPYGAFIARFLGNGQNATPLKPGGVLSFIVSDTFMTIKSHKELRQQMMHNYIHKMIRVHPDTFKATVNTAIIVCERNVYPTKIPLDKMFIDPGHHCQMVDMTNISIHDEHERFIEVLTSTEGFRERENVSNPEYAIYYYPQSLIMTNSNIPFFVASPKLFCIMNNVIAPTNYLSIGDDKIQCRLVEINNKLLQLATLKYLLVEICGGIKSYDNKKYIRSLSGSGGYDKVNGDLIVKRQLSSEEKANGIIIKNDKTPYYLEFEKGGETIKDNNQFNNYFYPTDFYFPWDRATVSELRPKNALRNQHRYFSDGVGVTAAGIYSPLFRYTKLQLFQNGFQVIFPKDSIDKIALLGILCSKLVRYLFNSMINHTVNSNAQDIEDIPMVILGGNKLNSIVSEVIESLKINPEYNYEKQQHEIDRLVYELYGLNADDIGEVENWYIRRYPKLAKAQNNNSQPKHGND